MSSHRPQLFDGGDETGDLERHDDAPQSHREPNYLIRRAIAVGVVVALIAGGSIVAARFLRDGDDAASRSLNPVEWNSVVLVDERIGNAIVSGADGEERGRIRVGARNLQEAKVAGTSLVATTTEAVIVSSLRDLGGDVDPDDDSITTIGLDGPQPLLLPSGSANTVIAHNAAANRAVFVHGPTGDILDTADAAPVPGARFDVALARSGPSGRNVLVTDTGNFQSVLFSFERDGPSFFPGLALAVDDRLVVTTQNVGNVASVTVFDHDRDTLATADTSSVRAASIAGDTIILVTAEGEVQTLHVDAGDVASGEQLAIGTITTGHVAPRGDRLIVIGTEGTAVVDTNGAVLAAVPGASPAFGGIDAGAPRRNDCLLLRADEQLTIVDLEDGSVVAEAISSNLPFADASGCRAVAPTPTGYDLISADGVSSFDLDGDIIDVSPDGAQLAVETPSRRLQLVDVAPSEDDDGAPIDIGIAGRTLAFTDV